MESDQTQAAATSEETTTTADASVEVVDPGEIVAAAGEAGEETALPEGSEVSAAVDDSLTDQDRAFLEKAPESVRERFLAIDPDLRKSFYEYSEEYIGKKTEDRINKERERNDQLAAEQKARDDRARQIREKAGRFFGSEEQEIRRDGQKQRLPDYDTLIRLSQNRAGRDRLYSEYGLDEDAAEAQIAEWDGRREMVETIYEDIRDRSLSQIDADIQAGLRAEGIDPASVIEGATNPGELISNLVRKLKGDHEAEVKKVRSDLETRIENGNLNAEAMRGKVAAGGRALATGGRTAGSDTLTLERFRAMPLEERKKLRVSNPALVDRLYAQDAAMPKI